MSAEDWTPERVELLRRLLAQGYSASQIAQTINAVHGTSFSRNAVIGKAIRIRALPDKALRADRKRQHLSEASRRQHAERRKTVKPDAQAPKADRFPSKGPTKSSGSLRFIDREPSQCSMFCEGEDGPEGFVCGRAVVRGGFCADCAKLVYTAVQAA